MYYSRVSVIVNGEREGDVMDFEEANNPAEEESPEFMEVEMGEVEMAEVANDGGEGHPPHPDTALAALAHAENQEEQARMEAERVIEEAKVRRYKGLGKKKKKKKKKRKHTRALRADNNQKTSSYNYPAARSELNLPPTADAQQIASTISPPIPKSPLKKQLKRAVHAMQRRIVGRMESSLSWNKKARTNPRR